MSLQKTKFLKEKVDKKLVVRHYLFQALIILMFAIVLYDSFFNEIPFYYICYLLMGLLVGRILSVAEQATAEAAHAAAQAADFSDPILNEIAKTAIDDWHEADTIAVKLKSQTSSTGYNIIPGLVALTIIIGLMFAGGAYFMGRHVKSFLIAFPCLMTLAIFSYLMGEQQTMKHLGFGYPAWAIVTGMLISNLICTPQ